MSRYVNLRKVIIGELLKHDELCATLLAKKIKCDPNSANRVMRELSQYLAKRPAPNEPGKNRVYYRVVDREGLVALGNEKRIGNNGTTSGTLAPKRIDFEALLSAWHIAAPRGCDLPTTVHRINMEDDQLFEEAA